MGSPAGRSCCHKYLSLFSSAYPAVPRQQGMNMSVKPSGTGLGAVRLCERNRVALSVYRYVVY